MGKLSYDDYMSMKKKGLVKWDEDLINSHSKNVNEFLKGTSEVSADNFDGLKSRIRKLDDDNEYVRTYINSLNGSDGYEDASKAFEGLDSAFGNARKLYDQYKDGAEFGESLKKVQAANTKKSGQQQEQAVSVKKSGQQADNEQESDGRSAQEYFDTVIKPYQTKKDAAEKRMAELDEIYRQTKYSTPEMQDEYAKLRKTVDEYDSKKKIYNRKRQAEKDENDRINELENNKRYAQKYDGASLNSLIQGYIDSDSESEKDWIKEAIKLNKRVIDKEGNTTGFSSDEVESAMNNLYERGKEEADRVNAAYEYDGYEDTKQETINHFQSKYGDAAYMLENLLHGKRRSETKERYTEKYKKAVNSKDYDTNFATWVQTRDERDDLDNKKYMTDEEYSVYTYLLNTEKEKDAEKYFESIKPELNQRMTQAQAQKEYELGNEDFGGAVLASLKSLGYNVISGGGFIEDVVNYATHNEIDTNSMLHMPSHLRDAERKGVSDQIGEDNPVGQWIYGTVMSVADNAINLAISKGIGKIGGVVGNLGKLSAGAETVNKISSTAASVIMGSQVATQTVIDCKDQGMDDGTAIGLGFIHGLVEHITEKVSIESILADPGSFKQSIAKSFISEGSEEVTANWVDRIADNLLLGDKSEEQQRFKELKAQGLSDTEAFTQVMLAAAGEDASAFFAGGISGVAMSGTSHAFNAGVKKFEERSANKSLSRTYQAIAKEASKSKDFDEKKKELIEQAKNSGDQKARKMAESFERTIENNGGKLDSIKVEDVGNMLQVLDVGAQKQEVIDSAKNAGDTEVEKAASALEEKVKNAGGDYGAVTVWETLDLMKAVENVRQYKSSVGINTDVTESPQAEAKEPTAAESMVKAGGGYEAQEIRNSYTDSGLKSKRIGEVNLNAFGAKYAEGIEATSRSDKNVRFQINKIYSSAKENNEGFNTVVLETSDGKLVNADEVTLKSTALDTLLRSADYFDTNGARGLLANYEGYEKYCKRNGREADVHEYLKLYRDAYSFGRNNIRYERLKKVGSTRFNSIARAIGIEQAENALNTGANDVDEYFKNENNAVQRLRMPGRRNAADSRVELDVNESFTPGYSDDQVMLLEAVAKKTGRSIVLTDKLEGDVNGVFGKDGKIYINANMESSDYMISVALHEAVHGLRDSAPAEYNALEKFVVNYLVESGESVDEMLDDIKTKWKQDAPSEDIRREELVAQTVMALASNERALKTAIECKANRDLLKKALDAIKRIAQGVRTWIEGIKKGDRVTGAHNKQAQPWIEDVKALEKLAKLFSKYMDEQRVAVQETTQERNQGGVRYSFGGERAKSADKTSLATAKQLDADGKSSEEIRQKTGWHKGYDGKWRFEIDDSMAKLVENPPLKLQGNNDDGYYRTAKLGDVLEHSKLFEAYPQLKNVTVIIQETEPGVEGISFNESKQIVLSQKLFERTTEEFKKLQESKQEEIKRIEQTAEYNEYNKYYQMDFSSVENPEQWLKEEKAARDKFFNSELGKRYYQLQWGKTNVQKTELGWSDKAISVLMHEVQHQIQKIEEFASGSNGKNKDYYNTAGEVEARDVQQRLNLNAEQRQKKRPDIDRDEVVFSDSEKSMEIVTLDNGKQYVRASEHVIKGDDSALWSKQVTDYINSQIRKYNDFSIQTAEGDVLFITRDTVYKAPTRNYITDKTSGKPVRRQQNDNEYLTKLNAEIHINELAEIAKSQRNKKITLDKGNHWFAKNGFIYRTAYFQDFDGKYYRLTISIGLNGNVSTVYNVNKITEDSLPSGKIVSTVHGSKAGNESSKINISQQSEKSNTHDGKKSVDDTIYDFITDEYGKPESAEDFEKIADEDASAAIKMIYRRSLELGKNILEGSGRVKLNESDYEGIAKNVLGDLGVNTEKNAEAVKELAKTIENFVENARSLNKSGLSERVKNNYFRNQYEGLASEISKHVKLSEQFVSKKKKAVERDVMNFIGNNTLLLRDFEIPMIQQEYGTISAFRTRLLGKTYLSYERSGKSGYHIEDLIEYINQKHPDIGYKWSMIDDGGEFGWLDNILNVYLGSRLERINDGVKYYEDEKSAGYESAMQVVGELGKALEAKQEGRVSLNDDVTAMTQNAHALRLAKLKLARERSRYQALKNKWDNGLNVMQDNLNREVRREFEERATKASTINGIRRIINRFRSAVMNPTDERFVPPAAIRAGIFEAFEALGNAAIVRDGTKSAQALKKMLKKIEELTKTDRKGESDADYEEEFDDEFKGLIRSLIISLEDKAETDDNVEITDSRQFKTISSKTLTASEAKQIYDLMREIEGKIIDARRQILRDEAVTNRESGERIIEQVKSVDTGRKEYKKLVSGVGAQFLNTMRAARMYSDYDDGAELMYHVNAINEGQEKEWFWAMNAEKMFSELTDKRKEEYRKSVRELVDVDFEGSDGKANTVKLTRMQGLTILMTWEREMRSNDSIIHMRTNGIEIVDAKEERKEHGKIHENMQKVQGVDSRFIAAVESKMGSFERDYKKIAEKYFNEVSKKAINETMLVLKHREIANSGYYIPMWVDENFTGAEISALKFDATIEGRGSYKNTVKSTLPIVITSLNSIVDRHIKDTAKLYGVAVPLRNFKKAFRIRTKAEVDKNGWFGSDSVKNALTEKFGISSVKLFENMVKDVEAGRDNKSSPFVNKLYKARVSSALAANISVVIKQAASYPTAGLYLSGKSLAAGLAKFTGMSIKRNYGKIIAEIDEHTAQHYVRRKGMSVQEVSDMMNSVAYKVPTVFNPVKWIQGVDCITTAALWEATKEEVNGKYKKNDIGSKEYWENVTKLYNKVIEDTQPMNDALHKAEIQKGAGDIRKSVFMFTTQPLQNTGILFNAIGEFAAKKGKGGSLKKLGKAVASQFVTLTVFSTMTFIASLALHKFDRWRDEEDKLTAQSILLTTLGDMGDNLVNLLMPYGGSYIEGAVKDLYKTAVEKKQSINNSLDAATLTFATDIYEKIIRTENLVANELNKAKEGKCNYGKILYAIFDTFGEGSHAVGVPYRNIMNIVNSAQKYWTDFNGNMGLTDNKGGIITEHMDKHIINSLRNGEKGKAEKYINLWKGELMNQGKSEDEATQNIKNKLADVLAKTDDDVTDAFIAYSNGDYQKYDSLYEKLHGYGFDQTDVEKAVNKVKNLIFTAMRDAGVEADEAKDDLVAQGFNEKAAGKLAEEYNKEPEEQPDDVLSDSGEGKKYKKADAFKAFASGDKEAYEDIKEYLVEKGKVEDGEKLDKDMQSMTYTGELIDSYLKALDAEYKDKSQKENREELKKQLLNIYGSWDKASAAIKKRQKQKQKK